MRIGIVIPGNIWFSPYLSIYTKFMDSYHLDYDVISWNRDGSDEKNGIQFERRSELLSRNKWINYIMYSCFVLRVIIKRKYDRLIVSGPTLGICLSWFLKIRYKNRYIIDYRDLSIEQKPILSDIYKSVLRHSYANFISSPGFKHCLPPEVNYYISHNFDIDLVRSCLNGKAEDMSFGGLIDVLSIGAIRNYSANVEIIKALANKDGIRLQFVGKGQTGSLKKYALENGIHNIEFKGYYPKSRETEYIKKASLLNIYFPRIVTHDTILSNRFYLSLIYNRPMIVNSHTTQGEYVEKYNVGLAIENCDRLEEKIHQYLSIVLPNPKPVTLCC